MQRAGKAASAENPGFKAKIPAIFLGHHIRGCFGGAEYRMETIINTH